MNFAGKRISDYQIILHEHPIQNLFLFCCISSCYVSCLFDHWSYGPWCLVSRHDFDQRIGFQSKLHSDVYFGCWKLKGNVADVRFLFVDCMSCMKIFSEFCLLIPQVPLCCTVAQLYFNFLQLSPKEFAIWIMTWPFHHSWTFEVLKCSNWAHMTD